MFPFRCRASRLAHICAVQSEPGIQMQQLNQAVGVVLLFAEMLLDPLVDPAHIHSSAQLAL